MNSPLWSALHGGYKYILVEGDASRTRSSCPGTHRALELDPAEVRKHTLNRLGGEDLQFATASEDPDPGEQQASK